VGDGGVSIVRKYVFKLRGWVSIISLRAASCRFLLSHNFQCIVNRYNTVDFSDRIVIVWVRVFAQIARFLPIEHAIVFVALKCCLLRWSILCTILL
jgi:hypothetical protein